MKKTILLPILALFLISTHVYADGLQVRYANYTYGINSLLIERSIERTIPEGFAGIYATGTVPNLKLYAVVGADFNFTDPFSVSLILQPGFEIVAGLPSDYSAAATSTGIPISVKKTTDGSVCNWQLFIRKPVKATIPYSLNFGSTYPYNSTTPDFNGWALRAPASGTTPQLAGSSSSFFLAFNPSLGTDSLVCNYYASNNNVQTGLTGIIESSSDGIMWTTIKSINNNLPKNDATAAEKRTALLLSEGTQYIRYTVQTKAATDPNVNINLISVKHVGTASGIHEISDFDTNITLVGHNMLIANNQDYKSIRLISVDGSTLLNLKEVNTEISLSKFHAGVYVVIAQKKDGLRIAQKIILN